MHPLALADELAEIRSEIARLKARETALRAIILAAPTERLVGRWHRIEVTEHRIRQFDPTLLPDNIRDNPAFWRERVQTNVRTLPAPSLPQRPGWPIRRDPPPATTRRAMH